MPTMTVQSAAMRRLRRELETSRMRAALAPARGITKKLSPTRLFPAPTASSAPRPARCADGLDHAPPSPFVVSHPCHAAAHAGGFSKGEQVRVRTPVGTLSTGQRLVLWLGAVVVSAAEEEDGYLGVSYTHYKHPCSDLSGAVRVPKKDVKDMLPPPAAAIAATSRSVRRLFDCYHRQPLCPPVAGEGHSTADRRREEAFVAEEDGEGDAEQVNRSPLSGVPFFFMDGKLM
ncbi:hypothetical protein EJB05_12360, partial [Eragrostis curvula]